MASKKLKYRIVNSAIENYDHELELDGETVTAKRQRLHIDAMPLDGELNDKSLNIVLPADHADSFPEGATLTVSLSVSGSTETVDQEA